MLNGMDEKVPIIIEGAAEDDFDEVLRDVFQKIFLMYYYGKDWKMPIIDKKKKQVSPLFQDKFISVWLVRL